VALNGVREVGRDTVVQIVGGQYSIRGGGGLFIQKRRHGRYMHMVFFSLNSMSISAPESSHTWSNFCRALADGQIKQMSSAYIRWLTTVGPTKQPTPVLDNSTLKSETYTLNKIGESRLPCGSPLQAENLSERV